MQEATTFKPGDRVWYLEGTTPLAHCRKRVAALVLRVRGGKLPVRIVTMRQRYKFPSAQEAAAGVGMTKVWVRELKGVKSSRLAPRGETVAIVDDLAGKLHLIEPPPTITMAAKAMQINPDLGAYLPTPEEIAAECAAIRKTWKPVKPQPYTIPEVAPLAARSRGRPES